jgi:hypothetical protein
MKFKTVKFLRLGIIRTNLVKIRTFALQQLKNNIQEVKLYPIVIRNCCKRVIGMSKEDKLFACDCGASFKTNEELHEHHKRDHT